MILSLRSNARRPTLLSVLWNQPIGIHLARIELHPPDRAETFGQGRNALKTESSGPAEFKEGVHAREGNNDVKFGGSRKYSKTIITRSWHDDRCVSQAAEQSS